MTAFERGYNAAKSGIQLDRNPYANSPMDYLQWMNGHTYYQLDS